MSDALDLAPGSRQARAGRQAEVRPARPADRRARGTGGKGDGGGVDPVLEPEAQRLPRRLETGDPAPRRVGLGDGQDEGIRAGAKQPVRSCAAVKPVGAGPAATAKRRSPLCGSTATVDLATQDGRVAHVAQEMRARALGQAAGAILGAAVFGRKRAEREAARDALRAMLTSGGARPAGPAAHAVVAVRARDRVFAAHPEDTVVAGPAMDRIVAARGERAVGPGPGPAAKDVVARPAEDRVVACRPIGDVAAVAAIGWGVAALAALAADAVAVGDVAAAHGIRAECAGHGVRAQGGRDRVVARARRGARCPA